MNHVPDAVLDRLDALGWATLRGERLQIAAGLRRDLRLHVAYDGGRGPLEIRFCHRASPADSLREQGDWVATYVDGVDRRLTAWGIRPPEEYTHGANSLQSAASGVTDRTIEQPAAWSVYAGRARLPGEPPVE